MEKINRIKQFIESLPTNSDSNEQFAMVISSADSNYGGDNTYGCSNQVLSSCNGINGGCTNYDDACAGSVNESQGALVCKNFRVPKEPIDPNV